MLRPRAAWIAAILVPALPSFASVARMEPPVPPSYRAEAPELAASWNPDMAALGKRLFQDRILSLDRSMACSDCHRPELAFTDGQPTPSGVRGRPGRRNTPTIVNRGLGKAHFWDGRAATLEDQALGPIANPDEMALPVGEAVARLAADSTYRQLFQRAFADVPTAGRLAQALAAYQRTLYSVDSAFDRFLDGDQTALSASAQRGLALFGGKARCAECHLGVNFTDEAFHCVGLHGDDGRGRVSGAAHEIGAFKTPTLREVARTAPYMHDGSMKTLAEVIDYYDKGGQPHPNLDTKMHRMGLTPVEKQDLIAFMEALSGTVVEARSAQEELAK